jgi:hypothetical protein
MQSVRTFAAAALSFCAIALTAQVAAAKSCERSCDQNLSICEAFPTASERSACARQMNRWCDRFCDEKSAAARPASLQSKKRN